MKRWRIVTLAWLAVAFLLIGLCGQEPGAGVNLPHPVAFSVRSLNLLVEPHRLRSLLRQPSSPLYQTRLVRGRSNSSRTTRCSCPNARVALHCRIREGHRAPCRGRSPTAGLPARPEAQSH